MNAASSDSKAGPKGKEQAAAGNRCPVVAWPLGLAGGIVGGVLGYLLFMVIVRQEFYAIVLPGALVGIGCGALSGRKSNTPA